MVGVGGHIRRVDDLGRIVLPRDYRRLLRINPSDEVEVVTDGQHIVVRKFEARCVFCGGDQETAEVLGKAVCSNCRSSLTVTA